MLRSPDWFAPNPQCLWLCFKIIGIKKTPVESLHYDPFFPPSSTLIIWPLPFFWRDSWKLPFSLGVCQICFTSFLNVRCNKKYATTIAGICFEQKNGEGGCWARKPSPLVSTSLMILSIWSWRNRMSRWKLGSKVIGSVGYNPKYTPFISRLYAIY